MVTTVSVMKKRQIVLPKVFCEEIRIHEGAPLRESVCRDARDDQFIACALAAQADAIVTRDNDLLSLGEPFGIPISDTATTSEPHQVMRPPTEKGIPTLLSSANKNSRPPS